MPNVLPNALSVQNLTKTYHRKGHDTHALEGVSFKVQQGELAGRTLYFLFQGAAPEKWMLEAGDYTMKRFASLYGMEYGGMATSAKEAEKLMK